MQNAKNYFGEYLLLSSEHLTFIAQNLNIFAIFRQKESEGRRERDRALGEVGWRNFQSVLSEACLQKCSFMASFDGFVLAPYIKVTLRVIMSQVLDY
ncbi:hypothetical protein DsansV1_C04g0038521 [Dioscorea sansibarensis]